MGNPVLALFTLVIIITLIKQGGFCYTVTYGGVPKATTRLSDPVYPKTTLKQALNIK